MSDTLRDASGVPGWLKSVGLYLIAFMVGFMLIAAGTALHVILDIRPDPFVLGFFGSLMITFLQSSSYSHWRARLKEGRFRERRLIELQYRKAAECLLPADTDIEVDVPRWVQRRYLHDSCAYCVVLCLVLIGYPASWRTVFFWITVCVGTLACVQNLCLWARGTLRVSADARGVRGYTSQWSYRRRYVPWAEIECCEIETLLDPEGKPIATRPVFKDPFGKVFMRLDLRGVNAADTARLLKVIKTLFPKTLFGDEPGMWTSFGDAWASPSLVSETRGANVGVHRRVEHDGAAPRQALEASSGVNEGLTTASSVPAWVKFMKFMGQCVSAAIVGVILGLIGGVLHVNFGVKLDLFALGFVFGLGPPLVGLLYERIVPLRIRGTLRREWIVEVSGRDQAQRSIPGDEVIAVGISERFHRANLKVFCGLVVLVCSGLVLIPPARRSTFFWVDLIGTAFGATVALSFVARGTQRVRADARSVAGYENLWSPHPKTVPWSEIESCEIHALLDSTGKRITTRPVFKDPFGKVLMRLDLRGVNAADTDRLLKFIKTLFPKTLLGDELEM